MFVYVDKPRWVTSFDIVYQIRKKFEKQKVWHSGTLDPFATWLMILAVGKDTKNLTKFIWLDKEYIAEIDLSKESDTRDMEYRSEIKNYELKIENWKNGIIIEDKFYEAPDLADVLKILNQLVPIYNLPLPAFSAKKVKWKRLYEMARKWKISEEFREMKIYEYEILKYEFPIIEVRFKVWSGTYIRSIAYRLGKQLGTWWLLSWLKRTKVWDYDMMNMKLDEKINFERKDRKYEMKFCVKDWDNIENIP